ncbi:radical SAM protein [bacterium]|nr:radical SAM protein [bacterium]
MSTLAVNVRKLARRVLEPLAYRVDGSFVTPSNISLSLTNRCNLKCPTCNYWQTPASAKDSELSLDEMVRLLTQLREWLGPYQIGLTGGEPFLRPEIFDLMRHAARLGVRLGTVNNGSLLPPRRIEELREVVDRPDNPLDVISFSLNHLDPAKHDKTRGVTGSADKVFKAIDALNYPGRPFRLTISTIVMGYNLDSLPDLVRWAREKGLDGVTFQIYYFQSGNDEYVPGWFRNDPFWDDDREKIDRGIDELIALRRQGAPITNLAQHLEMMRGYLKDPEARIDIPCRVGIANFDVEPNGDVRLCDVMKTVGNIRETHPREIWAGVLAAERRREIHGCEAVCRIKTCNFRKPLTAIALEQLGVR